jgi:hypothetical protein
MLLFFICRIVDGAIPNLSPRRTSSNRRSVHLPDWSLPPSNARRRHTPSNAILSFAMTQSSTFVSGRADDEWLTSDGMSRNDRDHLLRDASVLELEAIMTTFTH